MSTSYYNFLHNPSAACGNNKPQAAEARRDTTISPSSLATSSSNSSSSLERVNSLTPTTNVICSPSSKTLSSPSSISPSSSTSSSSTNSMAASSQSVRPSIFPPGSFGNSNNNDNATNNDNNAANIQDYTYAQQREQTRRSSVTPSRMHHPHQLQHSYTLHSLEPKPLKPFKSRSAYLDAMKEDLAEWLNRLYNDLDLTPDNFFSQLETGAIICRHANNVTQMGRNAILEQTTTDSSNESSLNELDSNHHQSSSSPDNDEDNYQRRNDNYAQHRQHSTTQLSSITSPSSRFLMNSSNSNSIGRNCRQWPSLTGSLNSNCSFRADKAINWFGVKTISYKKDAKPGTFFSRDNICQFILWCRSLDILECLLFETDDLVARKNEKSFILCLLEVARIGFKVGMPTPLIIQLEQEIDREIENDVKYQQQLEEEELRRKQANSEEQLNAGNEGANDDNNNINCHTKVSDTSRHLQQQETDGCAQVTTDAKVKDVDGDDEEEEEGIELAKDEEEYLEEDVGPKPQVVTNDLLSLHEKVVQLLCQCTCATQFPMVRIGDGKYKVGDKLIIFVRILRRHIMVRVGGGWQELSEFLNQKDPCRAKQLHHNHHYTNHHHQASLGPTKLTITTTATTAESGVSRFQSIGSSSNLSKSHYTNQLQNHSQYHRQQQQQQSQKQRQNYKHSGVPRLISGSASMSWLPHNS